MENYLEFNEIIDILDCSFIIIKREQIKNNNLKVYINVFPNEGLNNPHFHIGINQDNPFDCCIKIKENEYFIHGTHDKILNHKQLKILITFLNQKSNKYNGTNWQYIIHLWNKLNNDNIDEMMKIQDYINIKNNK